MIDHGDIFQGSTPTPERSYLTQVFKHARSRYKRLVVPCAGKFGAIEAAVFAGWKPEQISASDISLFTSTLACHLNNIPLDQVVGQIEADGDLGLLDLTDPPTVLYALKLAITRKRAKSYFDRLSLRDMEARPAEHIACLKQGMDALKAKIGGFHYEARDLVEHTAAVLDDPEAVIYVCAPAYFRGYDKLYDTGGTIRYETPPYTEFNAPKGGYSLLRQMMAGAKALGLRFEYWDPPEDTIAEAICVETTGGATGRSGMEYLFTNRPEETLSWVPRRAFMAKDQKVSPIAAPIYTDEHEFTEESQIAFKPISADQALYYRDLFCHRLGASNSEQHYALIVDGFLVGVVGFMLRQAMSGALMFGQVYVEETYGFCAPSYRYPRLNRLLMMLICSEEILTVLPQFTHRVYGLSTTCLCQHPELKLNRGIMKLMFRELLKDKNLYRLRYATAWHKHGFKEALRLWLTKHGRSDLSRWATR